MASRFSEQLSALRHEKGLSQKQAADGLGISQALLSHYENGIREPKLEFVVRACDYYGVTADWILGRQSDSGREEVQMAEALAALVNRLAEVNQPDQTAAAALCVMNAIDQLHFLLDEPGRVLPPELLIRQQQGLARLIQTLTETEA